MAELHRQANGQRKGKRIKAFSETPRLPTLYFLRAWNNALRRLLKMNLISFIVTLAVLNRLAAAIDECLKTEDDFGAELICKYVRLLVASMDRGSKNECATWFLVFHLRCNVLPIFDPFCHGLWNCAKQALVDCKHMGTVRKSSILQNWRIGPWRSGRWGAERLQLRKDMAQLKALVRFLATMLWAEICCQKGWHRLDQKDSISFERFLAELCREGGTYAECKGNATAMSRWFEWVHKAFGGIAEWSVEFVKFAFYALRLGHV